MNKQFIAFQGMLEQADQKITLSGTLTEIKVKPIKWLIGYISIGDTIFISHFDEKFKLINKENSFDLLKNHYYASSMTSSSQPLFIIPSNKELSNNIIINCICQSDGNDFELLNWNFSVKVGT